MTRQLVITVRSEHHEWTETYREGERGSFTSADTNLEMWAQRLLEAFNTSLRENETSRHVVKIEESEIPDAEVTKEHQWVKTNLVTIVRGSKMYDTARCSVCGITAKRYGLGGYTRDPKFAAERYEECSK
jgi:succinate dehydrogenase/fumarate reductase flavoprotein subunit